jgi:hypothetical protein
MIHTHLQNRPDMVIGQRIQHRFARSAAPHQSCLPQYAKLMGNCRLCHRQRIRNVADTLLSRCQYLEYFASCTVAEDLEQLRKITQRIFVRKIVRRQYLFFCHIHFFNVHMEPSFI